MIILYCLAFSLRRNDAHVNEPAEKAKALGVRIEDGTRIPVEITNKDSGERYRSRVAVTSNGEIYIPVEVQKLIEKASSVRIELL